MEVGINKKEPSFSAGINSFPVFFHTPTPNTIIKVGMLKNNILLFKAQFKILTYDFLNSVNIPSKPKQITPTKIRFVKIELSTPNGLQYTLKTAIIVNEVIIIFTRFAFSSERIPLIFKMLETPKAINNKAI